jgi:hypothetical protein
VKAQGQIVVAGEIDVSPAVDPKVARIARSHRGQFPPQTILPEAIEKVLVPAFASNHDPVLAKGLIPSNQSLGTPCQKPWKA